VFIEFSRCRRSIDADIRVVNARIVRAKFDAAYVALPIDRDRQHKHA
jgi:hypothetical protein